LSGDSEGTVACRFPAKAIVGSLGSLARELASGTEVPEEFIFVCALRVLGGMCSGELKINVGVEVDPRLYTVLLGSSYDVKKSKSNEESDRVFRRAGQLSNANLPSGFDSIDPRKPDVKQDQVWLRFFGFLNRFPSVCGFTDDL
jgi:hypothetical protein